MKKSMNQPTNQPNQQIDELEKANATLLKENVDMAKTITHLKMVIGGHLTANRNLRESNEKLKDALANVEKTMQEQKTEYAENEKLIQTECEIRKTKIEEKESIIASLEAELAEVKENLKSMTKTMKFYQANYEHYISATWYKRLWYAIRKH